MTKQELKKLMDEMAATASTEKMTEAGAAMSTYMAAHPEDSAEIMDWFNTAQQKMMAVMSGSAPSTPVENNNKSEGNFEYVFVPATVDDQFAEQLAWTYNALCAEIEKLKANDTKLSGLLLHTSGEPGFFDIQGWEMEDGEYLDELFMLDMDEEEYDDEEYDEDEEDEEYDEEEEDDEDGEEFDEEEFYAKEVPLFEAKPDIIGSAIARIHQEGKWADIISGYPFTIYFEVHDDGADTELLIIKNEQGARPTANEMSEALKDTKKRRTAEDFYNDILRGN